MSNTLVRLAELVAAIGAGLVGGVFFVVCPTNSG